MMSDDLWLRKFGTFVIEGFANMHISIILKVCQWQQLLILIYEIRYLTIGWVRLSSRSEPSNSSRGSTWGVRFSCGHRVQWAQKALCAQSQNSGKFPIFSDWDSHHFHVFLFTFLKGRCRFLDSKWMELNSKPSLSFFCFVLLSKLDDNSPDTALGDRASHWQRPDQSCNCCRGATSQQVVGFKVWSPET